MMVFLISERRTITTHTGDTHHLAATRLQCILEINLNIVTYGPLWLQLMHSVVHDAIGILQTCIPIPIQKCICFCKLCLTMR